MRAVQDSDFALFVGPDVVDNQHIQRVFIQTKFLRKRCRPLDNKQIELFSRIQETIVITQLSLQRGRFVARVTGHDTVNQRRAEAVCLVKPLDKGGRQRPLPGIAQDEFAQRVTVVVNQLARNNDPAFIRCTVEVAITLKQQSRQLRRVAHRRGIVESVTRVVADTRFGGVRENKAHIRIVRQFQERIILAVDVDLPVNRADKTALTYRFTLPVQAANDSGIETILSVQRRREVALNRTDDNHTGVKIGMFI